MLNNQTSVSIKAQSEENIPLILPYLNNNNSNGNKSESHYFKRTSRKTKSMPGIGKNEWDLLVPPDTGDDNDDDVNSNSDGSAIEDFDELTSFQASVHIIKASIGTGVLTLPTALKYSGYLLGTLFIIILSLCAIYTMRLLIHVATHLRSIYRKPIKNLDYEKLVKLCFLNSSNTFRKFVWMKHVLYVSLLLAQLGFLASYHMFISENLKSFIDFYTINESYIQPLWLYQIAFFFLLTPLVFIKSLDKLSYVCQLANLLAISCLITALVYCFQDPIPLEKLNMFKLSNTTFLAFGLVIFSFESINLINPIESNMKNKDAMLKPFGVLNLATGFVLIFYVTIGFAGYWKFGDDIGSSIILSIPLTPWYYMLLKPLYILAIFISYGLQAYVIINILWKKLKLFLTAEKYIKLFNVCLRLLIPTSSCILSIVVPHLDLFVSFTGALTGAMITLIIPGICHAVTILSNKDKYCWKLLIIIDIFIIFLGILGGCIGTYTSVLNIIKTFIN